MGYLPQKEAELRVAKVKSLLKEKNLDIALVYYDEFQHRQRLVPDRLVSAVRVGRGAWSPARARR